MHLKTNPKEVSIEDVLANQNVETGDNIDITKFPAPRMWPLDGGKYLGTNTAVITRDPESDRINVGTYRQMIKARDEIGLYTSPGKDAGLDLDKWWAKGKPMPVALCYGIDPLLPLNSKSQLYKDLSLDPSVFTLGINSKLLF